MAKTQKCALHDYNFYFLKQDRTGVLKAAHLTDAGGSLCKGTWVAGDSIRPSTGVLPSRCLWTDSSPATSSAPPSFPTNQTLKKSLFLVGLSSSDGSRRKNCLPPAPHKS